MLKLYGSSRSRASIVQWYLEEVGVPYDFVRLDMRAEEHRQPEFLEVNPIGKVPAIVDGDFKLWESGAILLYLSEKYGEMPESLEKRAEIAQWIFFANATLSVGLSSEATREREMPRLLTPLDRIFEKQTFMMGDQLTVADIAVGSILAYISTMFGIDFSDYPHIAEYVRHMSERPAFQKTIGAMLTVKR
ncbi:MAG: glutathione S-transferase family protein [Cyanobacteria bacterium SBC]|nr:glutathione S-transferase family protein [Cyanobacteria bacterium SBC]